MKKISWIVIGAVAVFVIGAAAYGLSPLLAFHALKAAAKSGDRDRIEEIVDFPAVRDSLKSQLAANLVKSMRTDPEMRDNPLAAMGALLAPAIIDRMVESIVTADGVAMLLSEGKVSASSRQHLDGAGAAPADDSTKLETTLSYKTLDRFRADLRRSDQANTTLSLTLERRGLFGWKLVRIDIPPSLFERTTSTESVSAADAAPTMPKISAEPDQRLMDDWLRQNSACRDSPDAVAACDSRERIGKTLQSHGWCWGHKDDIGADRTWVACAPSDTVAESAPRQEGATCNQPSNADQLIPPLGYVVTGNERLYFFSAPSEKCVEKAVFVVGGDALVAYEKYGNWTQVSYFSKDGKTYEGWVATNRLKFTGTMGRADQKPTPAEAAPIPEKKLKPGDVAADIDEKYKIVIGNEISKYEYAKRNGDRKQACLNARSVAYGYAQARDIIAGVVLNESGLAIQAKYDANYREWNHTQKIDCFAIGMPANDVTHEQPHF